MDFDERLRFPCSIIVTGVSGCGKTWWIKKLLENQQVMFESPVDSCLLCYGVYQPLYDEMAQNISNLSLVEGCNQRAIKQHGMLDATKKTILIIDDLHAEMADDQLLGNLFCKFSHHMNTTVIFLTQNLFRKGKQMRDVISNCHYLVFMAQPRDKTAIMSVARQMFPKQTNYFMQAYNDATSQPRGYLLIDARPETPEDLRLRSGLFPSEQSVAWKPI